jgi:hypothetical protein
MLRLYREQLANVGPLPIDESAEERRLAAAPPPELSVTDLPADIQGLIAQYESSHPGRHLTPLGLATPGADETPSWISSGDLPEDDQLVILAITDTALDAGLAEVRSRVLYARQTTSEAK